jgi:hypothetical protein
VDGLPRGLALTLAALLLSVHAAAQPPAEPLTPDETANPTRLVTFYPHVFDITAANPMPGNTQFPWGEDDFSAGYPDWGCYPAPGKPAYDVLPAVPAIPFYSDETRVATCDAWTNNLLYVYSTAGFVHADEDTWTYEDFHNERGQAKDILLDTTQDITATMYMSADWHGWYGCGTNPAAGVPWPSPCWNWDPGFYPGWRVQATLFVGSLGEYQGQASDPPPVHEKFLSGELQVVAQGTSAPVDMLSLDASLGGQGEVYEFAIDLGKPQADRIPREMDWILQYRWSMEQGGHTLLADLNWNVNSGEFYPNRFTLPVKNPFDVELVFPQFLHDKLLIHAMLNSPWGSYDVDARSVTLTITGSDQRAVEPQRIVRAADFSVAHGGHYKPVNITWVWDHKGDAIPPGDYTAAVEASNHQHSATSRTEAAFRIHPDGRGEVLRIGRSGQLTATQDQLATLGGP